MLCALFFLFHHAVEPRLQLGAALRSSFAVDRDNASIRQLDKVAVLQAVHRWNIQHPVVCFHNGNPVFYAVYDALHAASRTFPSASCSTIVPCLAVSKMVVWIGSKYAKISSSGRP